MLVEETASQLCMRLLIMMKGMPPGDQMGQPMLYFCTNPNLISTPNPKFLQKQKILQKLPTNVRKASRPSSIPHPHLCLDNRGAAASDPKAAKERSQRPSQADACQ